MTDESNSPEGDATINGSVVDHVLEKFIQALEAEPGFEALSVRIKNVLMVTQEDSEAALITAIFNDVPE